MILIVLGVLVIDLKHVKNI